MMLAWLVLVIAAQAPAIRDTAAAKAGTAVIRGRVVAGDTGAPLRHARVSTDASAIDPVFTDDQGRFELINIPPGRYVLSAAKAGYARTRFGARRLSDRPIALEVASIPIENVEIRMPRGAAISGRILDEFGDSIQGATAMAGRVVRTDGRVRVVTAGNPAETNDLGEYRIGSLPPGTYVVGTSATSNPMTTVMVSGGVVFSGGSFGDVARTWRLYYPGARSLAQAQPITLRAGEELEAIDFTPSPAPMPTLTLTLSDADGKSSDGGLVLVSETPFGPLRRNVGVQGVTSIKTALEPGEWVAIASGPRGTAIVPVSIGADDLTLNLVLGKGGRMSGRVSFDGSSVSPTSIEIEGALAFFDGSLPGNVPSALGNVNPDGTFVMSDLVGSRIFRLRSAPRGWILESLTYQGRSLLDGPIEFKGNEELTGVQAVLTDKHAELSGTVVDAQKMPLRDYSVLVFPEDRSLLKNPSRWIRWARPNQAGRFVVDDLPRGDYLVVALDDVDETQWSNADYLERFRARATRVTLPGGERKTITLELVTTP